MQLSQSKRRAVLGVLLCATLAATVWVNQREESPQLIAMANVKNTAPAARQVRGGTTDKALPVLESDDLLGRKKMEESTDDVEIDSDLFMPKSWYVAPPVIAQKPLPPPAPVAPPLPFSYAGSMEDGGKLVVYLTKGERAYSVSVGDTVEGTYKVESMDNGQIVFTYLPMSIKQTLKTGS